MKAMLLESHVDIKTHQTPLSLLLYILPCCIWRHKSQLIEQDWHI
jgi:hypothetical protein